MRRKQLPYAIDVSPAREMHVAPAAVFAGTFVETRCPLWTAAINTGRLWPTALVKALIIDPMPFVYLIEILTQVHHAMSSKEYRTDIC